VALATPLSAQVTAQATLAPAELKRASLLAGSVAVVGQSVADLTLNKPLIGGATSVTAVQPVLQVVRTLAGSGQAVVSTQAPLRVRQAVGLISLTVSVDSIAMRADANPIGMTVDVEAIEMTAVLEQIELQWAE
jgi:hypothetical protein